MMPVYILRDGLIGVTRRDRYTYCMLIYIPLYQSSLRQTRHDMYSNSPLLVLCVLTAPILP